MKYTVTEKVCWLVLIISLICCIGGPTWSAMERSKAMEVTLEMLNAQSNELSEIKEYSIKVAEAHRNARYGLWLTSIGGLLAGVSVIGLWVCLRKQLEAVKNQIDSNA